MADATEDAVQRLRLFLEHMISHMIDQWHCCRAVVNKVSPVQLVASVSAALDPPQHLYRGRQHLRICAYPGR